MNPAEAVSFTTLTPSQTILGSIELSNEAASFDFSPFLDTGLSLLLPVFVIESKRFSTAFSKSPTEFQVFSASSIAAAIAANIGSVRDGCLLSSFIIFAPQAAFTSSVRSLSGL